MVDLVEQPFYLAFEELGVLVDHFFKDFSFFFIGCDESFCYFLDLLDCIDVVHFL